ncbi:MAG: amidohydrolase [Pirellulales bacterium]|nr:amidohydrolase [Pirellulales bacterium]
MIQTVTRFVLVATLLAVLSPGVLAQDRDAAKMIILGGKIVTVDEDQPTAEALAVSGDRILALGTNDEIQKLADEETHVIHLNGELVIPGFIECHGHFTGVGQSMMMLDLRKARTWDDIVKQVADAAKEARPGEWIFGRGWHQEKWESAPSPNVEGYPVHTALSAVSPDNPVSLTHASGHMSFANAAAMKISNVTRATRNPPGGEIVHDETGEPIGVFRETAQSLIRSRRTGEDGGRMTAAERRAYTLKAIELATDECLRKGVTSFQDAGSPFSTIKIFQDLAEQRALRLRLWVMVRDGNQRMAAQLAKYRTIGAGDNTLTVRAIKRSIDGALGPHGAWLLQPYEDLPMSAGLNTSTIESIQETARLALANGYQLCVHAIGDRANREILNIYEEAFSTVDNGPELRWRVEHAQHLSLQDIPRFAQMGVIASMQGIHCTSDAIYVMQRLGNRRAHEGAYVWRKLLDSGAVVTNGSDAPVEDVDPIASYYSTVSRRLESGVTFFPEQAMTRMEALQSYTRDAAFSAFEEDIKGTLTPGKLADIVVLSKDILTCPENEIRDAKVLYTIVGGNVRYEAAK